MTFQERIINTCLADFNRGISNETHIRAVLNCANLDGSVFEKFLSDNIPEVRISAFRLILAKGDIKKAIFSVLAENNTNNLIKMLMMLSGNKNGLDELSELLFSKDKLIRDMAIEMFRKSGQTDFLFPLIFEDNDAAERIKRYINEKEG